MNNIEIKKYLNSIGLKEPSEGLNTSTGDINTLKESIEGLASFLQDNRNTDIDLLEKDLQLLIDRETKRNLKERGILFFERIRYSTAACILGLCSCICNFLFKKYQLNTDKIYSTCFIPLTHPEGTIRGENKNTEESAAIRAYEREDYYAAIKYYEKAIDNNPGNPKNHLFLGISLLATHQQQKAIVILKNTPPSERFYFDIQWYLALAYVKDKAIDDARTILFKLTSQENYYQYGAMVILEKLNTSAITENK